MGDFFDFDSFDLQSASAPTSHMNGLFNFDFDSFDVQAASAPTSHTNDLFNFDFDSFDVQAASAPTSHTNDLFNCDLDSSNVQVASAPTSHMNGHFNCDFDSSDVQAASAPTSHTNGLFNCDFDSFDVQAASAPTFSTDRFCNVRGPSAPTFSTDQFCDARGPSAPALPISGCCNVRGSSDLPFSMDVQGPSASNMRFILPLEHEVKQPDIRISRTSVWSNWDGTPERHDLKPPTLLNLPISAITLMSTEFMQYAATSAPAKSIDRLTPEEVKVLDISQAGALACAIRGNILYDIHTPTIVKDIVDISFLFSDISPSTDSYRIIHELTRIRAIKLRILIKEITAAVTGKLSQAQASLALASASWMLDAAQLEWSKLALVKKTIDSLAVRDVGKRFPFLFPQNASNGLVAFVLLAVCIIFSLHTIVLTHLIAFFRPDPYRSAEKNYIQDDQVPSDLRSNPNIH
jgi:hypothetical protein